MTDKNVTTLLPCPFCGSPAATFQLWGPLHGVGERVGCKNQDCFGPCTTASTLEDSIVQWNTRAHLSAAPRTEPCGASEEEIAQIIDPEVWGDHASAVRGWATRRCEAGEKARAILALCGGAASLSSPVPVTGVVENCVDLSEAKQQAPRSSMKGDLLETALDSLDDVAAHALGTPGLFYDSVEELLESAVGTAKISAAIIRKAIEERGVSSAPGRPTQFSQSSLSPLPQQQEGGWRDIASAPKDGTAVLFGWAGDPYDASAGHIEEGVCGWLGERLSFHPYRTQPSHWQPLPAPPEAK